MKMSLRAWLGVRVCHFLLLFFCKQPAQERRKIQFVVKSTATCFAEKKKLKQVTTGMNFEHLSLFINEVYLGVALEANEAVVSLSSARDK